MLYHRMNRTTTNLSIIGFGCMRLPQTTDCRIDEPKATAMVRHAIDRGVLRQVQRSPVIAGCTKASVHGISRYRRYPTEVSALFGY